MQQRAMEDTGLKYTMRVMREWEHEITQTSNQEHKKQGTLGRHRDKT